MNEVEKNILLSSNQYRNKRRFWIDKLAGDITFTRLLPDITTKEWKEKQFGEYEIILPKEAAESIMKISSGNILSQYIICLAAIKTLIHKYTNEEDIYVYTPIHSNNEKERTFNEIIFIKDTITPEITFKKCILSLKKIVAESFANQEYPLDKVIDYLGMDSKIENALFSNVACVFEGIHLKTNMDVDFQFHFQSENGYLKAKLLYNSRVYTAPAIERLCVHFVNILTRSLENLDTPISKICMLMESEIQFWLEEYNTAINDTSKINMVQLFEKQAEITPNQIAIEDNTETITYQMLNKKANQLSRYLKEKKVTKESIIGIMLDNSIELVIALLAVLKCQASYLPIDTIYPNKRIEYMLKDSNAYLVLSDREKPEGIDYENIWVQLKNVECYVGDSTNLNLPIDGEDIAYLMYTSGTTGLPKGALIKHKGLVNYICWAAKLYLKGEPATFPLYSSISFDLTVTSIYTPIITGGKIVVYNGADKIALIQRIIEENKVDILKLTPTHLGILEELDCSVCNIRKFIVGGENLKADLVRRIMKRFGTHIQVYNEYGPTETVVGCMTYLYNEELDKEGAVPIGIPAENVHIYLMDNSRNLIPEGVIGEVYIAGEGVARGYLNKPEVNQEKFVPNPYCTNEIMYRTGDYAKLLPTGNILYIGRKDGQVKIRGFRIELGEIEEALLKYPGIKDAAVLVQEDDEKSEYIAAYIIHHSMLSLKELKNYLMLMLPEYMIPKYFYKTSNIPVTINGKIDKTLLTRNKEQIASGIDYMAPRTDMEKLLASIYEEVLNIQNVGIYDDFFSLGGDSIKAIRVSAKLQKYKMYVGIQDIFQYPTIEQISKYVEINSREIEQGVCTGEVSLSPIQSWFFEKPMKNRNHYNQSIMLYAKDGFNPEIVKKVFQKLAEHHDSLRLRYSRKEEEWIQSYSEVSKQQFLFETVKMNSEQIKNNQAAVVIDRAQRALDIEKGPLLSLLLIQTEEGDHLLIAAHHLVMDGVSFRILLEDFYSSYQEMKKGNSLNLPDKTDSYQAWSKGIWNCFSDDALDNEKKYWKQFSEYNGVYFKKLDNVVNMIEPQYKSYQIQVDKNTSNLLLTKVNTAFKTEISDILLTALGLTIKELTGENNVVLSVEGHGREELQKEVNITRTIGWFTSIFPVMLDMSETSDLSYLIRHNKELMRKIPNRGIGYGILKYLTSYEGSREAEYCTHPEICFNYLGQVTNEMNNDLFCKSELSSGNNTDGEEFSEYPLEINGMYDGMVFSFSVRYDSNVYPEDIIHRFMDTFRNKLCILTDYCCSMEEQQLTPSDYGDQSVTLKELDIIQNLVKGISLEIS